MEAWSTSSKVGLGIASCAVFAIVALLAGRDTRAQPESRVQLAVGATRHAESVATSMAPATASEAASEVEELSSPALPPAEDLAAVAELSRQVTPLDETTAEENEQRGDAIRRLGSSQAPGNAQPLIHALRNDVDIRNRILAIDGLRRAALAGNPDRGIYDALVEASRSDDEVIASQARQALAEIERARPR